MEMPVTGVASILPERIRKVTILLAIPVMTSRISILHKTLKIYISAWIYGRM
jgi:hypothetical protein